MRFQEEYFKLGYDIQKHSDSKLEKTAGIPSEVAGTILNPFSSTLLVPAGLLGYGYGGSEEAKEIPDGFGSILSNLLVPGVAPYRLGKRFRGEMDEGRETRQHLRAIAKKRAEEGQPQE